MEQLVNYVKTAFKSCCKDYEDMLQDFEPWAEQHCIHETNQVANFISSYKNERPESIACLEFSIPYIDEANTKKTDRIDGLIIDEDKVIFIEAKRFSRGTKITDLQKDLETIDKIISVDNESRKKLKERLPDKYKTYKCCCLLLADFWNDHKHGIPKMYMEETNLKWEDIWKMYEGNLSVSHCSNDSDINTDIYEGKYYLAYALFELEEF